MLKKVYAVGCSEICVLIPVVSVQLKILFLNNIYINNVSPYIYAFWSLCRKAMHYIQILMNMFSPLFFSYFYFNCCEDFRTSTNVTFCTGIWNPKIFWSVTLGSWNWQILVGKPLITRLFDNDVSNVERWLENFSS